MPARSGETPVPTEELAAAARRALAGAGYTTTEQVAEASEAEIGGLHGVGPSAPETLHGALAARGTSIAGDG